MQRGERGRVPRRGEGRLQSRVREDELWSGAPAASARSGKQESSRPPPAPPLCRPVPRSSAREPSCRARLVGLRNQGYTYNVAKKHVKSV